MEDNIEVVPETTDSGDFGEGALDLEQQLLSSIEEKPEQPEVTEEQVDVPEVKAEEPTERPEVETAPTPAFDVEGRFQLKAGDKLTDDHLKELERGFLRQSDYTRKTQEIAKVRDTANEVLAAKEAIDADPKQLRQYFEDKQILSAFSELELLNIGLSAAKVPVEAWNAFKQWYQESGYAEGKTLPTANPHLQEVTQLKTELSKIGKTVQQFQQEKEQQALAAKQREMEEKTQKEYARYDAEIAEAMKKYEKSEFPLEKEDIILAMARDDGTKSIAQIAKALHDKYAARFGKYIEGKKTTKQNTVKPIKGQPVNIVQRAPKNFDEADALIDQIYGDGSLKSRIG